MPRKISLDINFRQLALLVIFALAVYVIIPQFGDLKSSWHVMRYPEQPAFIYLALGFTFLTYPIAALIYQSLAFKPIDFRLTWLIQLAAMFMNRLLPAGLGALGANYLYLRNKGHTVVQAGSVISVNNLLGFIGHCLIVGLCLLFYVGEGQSVVTSGSGEMAHKLIWIAAVITVFAMILVAIFGHHRISRAWQAFSQQLLQYKKRPRSLLAALAISLLLTLSNVMCFVACLSALGVSLPFAVSLIIFTLGVGVAAATPTPGGLGGFEAGLAAGLIANGIEAPTALASALLYRIISYWVPLLVGGVAMFICQRRGLFELKK